MLTVLLATRNREKILGDVLETYCHLEAPSGGWKLVVVDNGSTDRTPAVLDSFRGRLPLHALAEPVLGKNHALNAGLALVEGDLVVFTDDDAFPHTEWLVQLRKAADTHLGYSMFGGPTVPRWEIPPPHWIEWVHRGLGFALSDPSQAEGPIPPAFVVGPNMAIRACIFQSGIHFDPSIGPRGSDYPMGSETELLLRLGRMGHNAWYVSNAVVEHFIREEQLRESWMLKRAIRYGRGVYRLFYADGTFEGRLWMGVPRHLFRDIPKEGVLALVAWTFHRQEALFRSRWNFNVLRGQAIEACAIAQSKRIGDLSPAPKGVTPDPDSVMKEP